MNPYSDREILDLFQDESTKRKAFAILVEQYQKRLYWVVRKLVIDHDDADDVLQNVFLKIWRGLEHFREDSKLFSWLYRIAMNESISFLKQKKRDLALSRNAFCEFMSNQVRDHRNLSCEEIEEKLQQAILTLPEKQRMVFHLRYYDEMPYEDMSEVFGTSTGALKASYHIAMKKIEKYLMED